MALFSDSSTRQDPAQHLERSSEELYKAEGFHKQRETGTRKVHWAKTWAVLARLLPARDGWQWPVRQMT